MFLGRQTGEVPWRPPCWTVFKVQGTLGCVVSKESILKSQVTWENYISHSLWQGCAQVHAPKSNPESATPQLSSLVIMCDHWDLTRKNIWVSRAELWILMKNKSCSAPQNTPTLSLPLPLNLHSSHLLESTYPAAAVFLNVSSSLMRSFGMVQKQWKDTHTEGRDLSHFNSQLVFRISALESQVWVIHKIHD